ncbi:MAG: M56 family metallopeptidase, partial [Angelakisella sp.]
MTAFFVRVLNMSITASVVALLMLIIRGAFRKRLPATYCYLLEGIVFFRLVVPFSVPAAVSLFNLMGEPPASERQGAYIVTMDYLEGAQGYVPLPAADNGQAMEILAVIWFSVVVLMLLYGVVTYIASVLRVRTAFVVHCDDILQSCTERVGLHRKVKIYRSDAFDTPVVMGIFRPR